MKGEKRNLAASVAARLLNQKRQTGGDYQTIVESFCYERFLYRLGQSDLRERYVLKGAMLLRLWADQPYRSTRDLDVLRLGDGSFVSIRADVATICRTEVEPDGVEFDAGSIEVAAIRAEEEFAGARVTLGAKCHTARLDLQVDMGIGDPVWPAPKPTAYPTLLDMPRPSILAYPPEAVIAEKLEAIVVLGDRNSRIRDYFDLDYLARHFTFDRQTLAESIRRTFARRSTPIPSEGPIGLTSAYWDNPSRPPQIKAFARRPTSPSARTQGRKSSPRFGCCCCPFFRISMRGLRRGGPGRPEGLGSERA